MGARALLTEMLDLLRAQTGAIIAGDHQAVSRGADRHEALLSELRLAEVDISPDELQTMLAEIDREKLKLQSLLQSESNRVDFMLRLILGGGQPKAAGYPGGLTQPPRLSRGLDRRT